MRLLPCVPDPAALLLAAAFLRPAPVQAQQVTDVGTPLFANSPTDYPAPYGNWAQGARHQLLIRASELQAAGMQAGTIQALAFQVIGPAGAPLEDFTIRLGTTEQPSLLPAWVDGLAVVYGPTTYIDIDGWNTHPFDTPFVWDGSSNLVVETCFRSPTTTVNAQLLQCATPFTCSTILANADPAICSTPALAPFNTAQRPIMRFTWLQAPPQAAFHPSSGQSCNGTVRFHDTSSGAPTSWQWDLGDGTTAEGPDVTHTYMADGVYTATLTVSNAFGTTSITGEPIAVDLSGPRPIAACTPASPGTVAGIGITNVVLAGAAMPSADAVTEGYADHSCVLLPVTAGSPVALEVATGTATTHNVRAWVDWDDSGTFAASELVLSADHVLHASTSFLVPAFAPVGVPLRVRVIADYDLSAVPQPCTAPAFGQAEDYGLLVTANTDAPDAGFTATPTHTCTGTVQFADTSYHLPTAWSWDFGDGGSNTDPSPQHTYGASGTYLVTLTTSNAAGSDQAHATITVDLEGELIAATCAPATQTPCCGYGLTAFTFAGIASTSGDGSEGYVDRSCGDVAQVEEGHVFPFAAGTGGMNGHDVAIWIDLDNDGAFATSERLYAASNVHDPTGSILVPGGAVTGIPLRLRVIADVVGAGGGPCDAPLFGQCEDFAVTIAPNTDPPTALFDASPRLTCTGAVQFIDQSTGVPTGWNWDFGDGGSSTDPSPQHAYTAPGAYDVTLTVSNANGIDTQTAPAFITVLADAFCDTVRMPLFNDQALTACTGVLTDDGGPNGSYAPGLSAKLTIAPPNATSITLTFSQFAWETGLDYLDIYEGPDTLGLSLGAWTGELLPPMITSATGAITLQQRATSAQAGWPGFIATWECTTLGIGGTGAPMIAAVWPQPADGPMTVSFRQASTTGWRIAIHNALGAKIMDHGLQGGMERYTFDTDAWSPGCYVLTLDTGHGRWSRAIVVR